MAKTRLQEATEQRFSRFEGAYEQRFSRFEEKIDQRFSRLEEMIAALGVSRKQNQADQRESFTKPQVIQENDDRSPLDRYSPSSQKAENEVATELIETKQGIVKPEAKENVILANLEEEPISQLQVPVSKLEPSLPFRNASPDVCEDFESLVGFDGLFDHVKTRNELVSKSTSVTNNQVAHQLFDKMSFRVQSKRRQIKHLKGWKFKFKRKSWVGIKLQIEQYKLSKRRRRMYNKLPTNIKVESAKEIITENHPRMLRQLHKSRVQSKMRMKNESWSMRQPTLKIMKSHRKHKWKSKQLQIASSFWINHSHKLADLVLRTALTDWRTKNSKGLAYDGCDSLEINLAGFGRGKTEMLATSHKMQKMDLFSFGIHTEMEENVELKQLLVAMERFSQEVIEPKMEGGLICGDERFQIKHKWRFKLLLSILELEVDQLLRQFQELFEKLKLAEEKESKLQVLDLHQTFLCHQIGCGIDILLVVKVLNHDKEMAVVLQRLTSLTTRDCPDRSSRANRVWKPGLEIYGCVIKKQMLLNDKLANHVWHRWKNKAGKLRASLVCWKEMVLCGLCLYDHTVVLRKEPILSPKIKRGFELSYLPNLEVKVSLKGGDLI